MQEYIPIAESDYSEIMRWDDDGGRTIDLLYHIVPDGPEPLIALRAMMPSTGNPPTRRGGDPPPVDE